MKLFPGRVQVFLREPGDCRVVLLYGDDAGMIRDRAEALVRAVAGSLDDPFLVTELPREEIRRLPDEASGLSLTGGRRAVRVRDVTDAAIDAVQALLQRRAPALVVLEAPTIPARSKLRTALEAAADARRSAATRRKGARWRRRFENRCGPTAPGSSLTRCPGCPSGLGRIGLPPGRNWKSWRCMWWGRGTGSIWMRQCAASAIWPACRWMTHCSPRPRAMSRPPTARWRRRWRGLRPGEQRVAEGLAKTTLAHTWQQRRVVERVAEMTERLGALAREQGAALEALGRLAPAIHDVVMRAPAAMQPVLQRVAEPWRGLRRQRQHAVERQHEHELTARLSRGPSLGL